MDSTKAKKGLKKGVQLSFDENASDSKPKTKNVAVLKRRGTPHPKNLKSVDMSESEKDKKEESEEEEDQERTIRVGFANVVVSNDDDNDGYVDEDNDDDQQAAIDDDFDDRRRIQMRRPTPHPSRLKAAQGRTKSLDITTKKALLTSQQRLTQRKMSEPAALLTDEITKL